MDWVIEGQLCRAARPGYPSLRPSLAQVRRVVAEWQGSGVRSIICLLAMEQLDYYAALPDGLIEYYRNAGIEVAWIPVDDHRDPPVPVEAVAQVIHAWEELTRPVLIHCSAGVDRTGAAVQAILREHAHG